MPGTNGIQLHQGIFSVILRNQVPWLPFQGLLVIIVPKPDWLGDPAKSRPAWSRSSQLNGWSLPQSRRRREYLILKARISINRLKHPIPKGLIK